MERSRHGITFTQLIAFVAVALPVVAALRWPFSAVDLAYLIRAGDAMLNAGEILRTDAFTFTIAGQGWLNQQWGAEIAFALLHGTGEWIALVLARAALVGIIFWLEFCACRAAGAGRRSAGWLTLAAFVVCFGGLGLRSNLFGMAFFALTLWIVAGRSRRPRLLWLLPVIVAVWANTHGSFLLAPLPIVIAWLEDRRQESTSAPSTLVIALACIAATFANPYGVRVWEYVAHLAANPWIRQFVTEWQPTRPTSMIGVSFFVSVVVVAVIAVRRRSRLAWPRILGLIAFFALGVQAVRGVLWWALAAPVLIAGLFPERTSQSDTRGVLNAVIATFLALLMILMLPWFRPTSPSASNSLATNGMLLDAPARLDDAVAAAAGPGSRVFVAQIWASWFELDMPDYPVFVDSRIELFPVEVWEEYQVVSSAGEGWEEVLDRWKVDVLVLSWDQQAALIEEIAHNTSWQPVYRDADGVALVRTSPTSPTSPNEAMP